MVAFLALSTTFVFSQKKNKSVTFEVDGVCFMCKARIEKAALSVTGVKYAKWDIPSHQLSLIVDERKTNAMAIKTALVVAGHDTKELKAPLEVYEELHPCCHYREIDADNTTHH